MIRFINLRDQITEGENRFAFYDTVTDTFCAFSGSQSWTNFEEFEKDYDGKDIQRFRSLFMNSFSTGWKNAELFILGHKVDIEPVHFYVGNRGKWQRIEMLEQQLKEALATEDYLKASEIKQQIEALKKINY